MDRVAAAGGPHTTALDPELLAVMRRLAGGITMVAVSRETGFAASTGQQVSLLDGGPAWSSTHPSTAAPPFWRDAAGAEPRGRGTGPAAMKNTR